MHSNGRAQYLAVIAFTHTTSDPVCTLATGLMVRLRVIQLETCIRAGIRRTLMT